MRVLAATPLSAKTRGVIGWAGSSGMGAAGGRGWLSEGDCDWPLSSVSSVPRSSRTASCPLMSTGLWAITIAAGPGRSSSSTRKSPSWLSKRRSASSPRRPSSSRADWALGLAAVTVTR